MLFFTWGPTTPGGPGGPEVPGSPWKIINKYIKRNNTIKQRKHHIGYEKILNKNKLRSDIEYAWSDENKLGKPLKLHFRVFWSLNFM